MSQPLKLEAIARKNRYKQTYYFTRPNIPCLVDLSKVVIFVHPVQFDNGEEGADIVFKTFNNKRPEEDELENEQ